MLQKSHRMTNLRLGHRVHVSILRGELMSTNIPPKKHCQKHNFLKIISFTLTVSNGKNLEIETPPAKESFLATPLTESQGKEQLGLHKVKKYWISKYFLKKERFWLSVPSLRVISDTVLHHDSVQRPSHTRRSSYTQRSHMGGEAIVETSGWR